MEKRREDETIIQNLKDAGCQKDIIDIFTDTDDKERQLRILSAQRKQILEQIHVVNARLECLDYLIYTIRKEI